MWSMAPSASVPVRAVESRSQEVVALDGEAAEPAGAPHDHVLEVDDAFGAEADLIRQSGGAVERKPS